MSDFTFKEFLTGILKFNDENVMHIGFNSDTEDIIITNWNAVADTAKTLQTNLNGGGGAVLGPKTITANGTYDASDDDLDGYDQVTVNVPSTNKEAAILDGSLSGSYENMTVTSLRADALSNMTALTSVNLPLVTTAGQNAFKKDTNLTSVTMPELTTTGTGCFTETGLTSADFPKLTTINGNAFDNCPSLTSGNFPAVTRINGSGCNRCRFTTIKFPSLISVDTYGLANNPNLTAADFGTDNTSIGGGSVFLNDSSLTVLVLRASALVNLPGSNSFNGTPIASDGTGGDIYVKSSLISDYEIATNWSALNVTFKAIEGSYYETHYVDGTEIPA